MPHSKHLALVLYETNEGYERKAAKPPAKFETTPISEQNHTHNVASSIGPPRFVDRPTLVKYSLFTVLRSAKYVKR